MRRTYSVLLIAAVLLSFGWMGASSAAQKDCCHPSAAKSGSSAALATTSAAPMPSLSADDARKTFNASSQKVRVVALLSPTCPDCRSGHGVVGRVLTKFPSPKLKAILVWEPMRDGDDATSATQQAETVQDIRISQGWDGDQNLGKVFGQTLDLHQIAWDVYLVYKPGIKWEGPQPPRPTFWMLLLCENPTRMNVEVVKLLEQMN